MAGSCQSRGLSISVPHGHRCSLGSQNLVIEEELGKEEATSQARLVSKTKVAQRQELALFLLHLPPTIPLLVTAIVTIMPSLPKGSCGGRDGEALCLHPPPWPFWSIVILFKQHDGQGFRDTVARDTETSGGRPRQKMKG